MAKDDSVPGLTLEPSLEAKLDNLDDNLQPINKDLIEDGSKDKTEESDKDAPEDKEEEQTTEEEESTGDETNESDESEHPDDGYTIDEGEEESEEQPSNSTQESTDNLNPEQKYILDNLTPITVRGTVGDSKEVKEYKVYSPEYLPRGFKYTDDRELSSATKAFSSLENRALQLQNDYRNQESQKATEDFKKREDTADRQDIAELQRDGQIPRFKAQPDSADFESDPGVVVVQEVIDFKEAQNAKYLEEYNAGRPYKHIGFDEAFRMFQRTAKDPAQDKEDTERVEQAKRTSKTSGQSSTESVNKPRVHSGMGSMDLDNLIESKTADW